MGGGQTVNNPSMECGIPKSKVSVNQPKMTRVPIDFSVFVEQETFYKRTDVHLVPSSIKVFGNLSFLQFDYLFVHNCIVMELLVSSEAKSRLSESVLTP